MISSHLPERSESYCNSNIFLGFGNDFIMIHCISRRASRSDRIRMRTWLEMNLRCERRRWRRGFDRDAIAIACFCFCFFMYICVLCFVCCREEEGEGERRWRRKRMRWRRDGGENEKREPTLFFFLWFVFFLHHRMQEEKWREEPLSPA